MAGYQSAEEARKVLQKLIDLAKEDQSIKEGAAGTELTVSFELMDLDLVFNLSFIDGQVDGFIGEPEEEPMVTLSMDSEVLDSIFSGEMDAASAAMSGDLSFSGDVGNAMGLQILMNDFVRLYQEARSA
ncbi:MAG TPA: SCP2 sterol-binding domain-containing protein [Bacillota bacterium]|jgi:putative sterol carrier protein|nr:SCP2 sterol-binding domain-containing protein [Bacillota bacterium]HOB87036.1 SCP2 sterol-binding domain-containing protein [Bacillota bacterium]HOP69708.1 SCP2 sterol-binding domain-containing protein [Bacillota bacterium]HPT34572.1 SCP2 sterol-binding domain-containing protein [Bacillota bacterium]HPZ64455.1 SCP2 sterol-binding domain-containing protein [Bacillota bacterium]